MEGRSLPLRALLHLAEQFTGGSLVHPAGLFQPQNVNCLQNAQHAQGVHIARVFRGVKTHLNMALGGKIVNFIRPHCTDNSDNAGRIRHVAAVQRNASRADQVVNALGIAHRSTAYNAVYFVSFFQQKLCQIAAILPGNAGDECFFHCCLPNAEEKSSIAPAVFSKNNCRILLFFSAL